MDDAKPRPSAGIFVSLLMAIGLLGLFFMPWLNVSCDLQAAANAAELRGIQGVPEEFTRPTVLAHASGWDLARGELTPEERFKGQVAQENAEGPPAKAWAYGGLVLPGLLVGLALLCICGRLSSGGAGKWMLLLGIAGVVLMFVAASMDYIDEAMDKAKEQMAAGGAPLGCPAFRQSMAAATDQAKKVIQTKTTPYLWACLGIYVVITGYGLVRVGIPEEALTAESVSEQDGGEEALGGGPAPAWATPIHDSQAGSPPPGMLGPPLTARNAPAAGDKTGGQA